jgi:hypothetical protein
VRQHTSACRVHARLFVQQHCASAYVGIRRHTSAYVSIRQHTAACRVRARLFGAAALRDVCVCVSERERHTERCVREMK